MDLYKPHHPYLSKNCNNNKNRWKKTDKDSKDDDEDHDPKWLDDVGTLWVLRIWQSWWCFLSWLIWLKSGGFVVGWVAVGWFSMY